MSESDTTPEQGKNKARRRILKTLVTGGSALTASKVTPDQWIKPVVESVIIPSHAQTTGGAGNPNGNFAANGAVVDGLVPDNSQLLANQDISDELLEFFMPSAQASNCPSNATCQADFGAEVQNSSMFICVFGGQFGSFDAISSIPISGSQLQIMGSESLGDFNILSGQFNGRGWDIEMSNGRFTNNASPVTTVTLNPDALGGCARRL